MNWIINSYLIPFLIYFLEVEDVQSRAHHKVHNLALYPERHSWCQATPIRQEIAHAPECEPTVIDNMVCLGACFSYSVPRAQDNEPIAPYCDKCDKTFSSWTVVTLNCTREAGDTYTLTRNVELISNCSCVDCNDSSARRRDEEHEEHESPEDDLAEESLDSPNDLPPVHHGHQLQNLHHHHRSSAIPTLHKLKSVSAELTEFRRTHHHSVASDDEDEAGINNNQIVPSSHNDNNEEGDEDDDDHEHGAGEVVTHERQRYHVHVPTTGTGTGKADHDL